MQIWYVPLTRTQTKHWCTHCSGLVHLPGPCRPRISNKENCSTSLASDDALMHGHMFVDWNDERGTTSRSMQSSCKSYCLVATYSMFYDPLTKVENWYWELLYASDGTAETEEQRWWDRKDDHFQSWSSFHQSFVHVMMIHLTNTQMIYRYTTSVSAIAVQTVDLPKLLALAWAEYTSCPYDWLGQSRLEISSGPVEQPIML